MPISTKLEDRGEAGLAGNAGPSTPRVLSETAPIRIPVDAILRELPKIEIEPVAVCLLQEGTVGQPTGVPFLNRLSKSGNSKSGRDDKGSRRSPAR